MQYCPRKNLRAKSSTVLHVTRTGRSAAIIRQRLVLPKLTRILGCVGDRAHSTLCRSLSSCPVPLVAARHFCRRCTKADGQALLGSRHKANSFDLHLEVCFSNHVINTPLLDRSDQSRLQKKVTLGFDSGRQMLPRHEWTEETSRGAMGENVLFCIH